SNFLLYYAYFSTIGMIIGTLKSMVNEKTCDVVSKCVQLLILEGILESLLKSCFVVLFAW
ncbi:NupC/NupG family nucleoside CNT transporter, partial [Staphylococcus pseudintermedius]